jgi:hypothetical protein
MLITASSMAAPAILRVRRIMGTDGSDIKAMSESMAIIDIAIDMPTTTL